jgi:hypothetical protein
MPLTVRTVGILTDDFELSYDLIAILRRRGLQFKTLDPWAPVHADVAVVLTGPDDRPRADRHKVVVAGADREGAVAEAVKRLTGKVSYRSMVMGVDPGEKRIGFAALGDGALLEAQQLKTVGEVEQAIDSARARYPSGETVVRVGHGAPTIRNRIVNAALGRDLRTEIADETSTTRRVERPDVEAAIAIASKPGATVWCTLKVNPTSGELRHFKNLSREHSGGELTISTELSRRVALGEISLDEAVSIARDRGSGKGERRI